MHDLTSTMGSTEFSACAVEILEKIIPLLDARTRVALANTCTRLRKIIECDELYWKSEFSKLWDHDVFDAHDLCEYLRDIQLGKMAIHTFFKNAIFNICLPKDAMYMLFFS
jgi:hypothetical protein